MVLLFSARAVIAQKVEYIKVPELEKILKNPENKLFVVNFWATWCPPCVKELPDFANVVKAYDPKQVSFIFVSLDFPGEIKSQLIPFLKKNRIDLHISAMMETDANLWIEKVDPAWQGDIPATLFFNNSKKPASFSQGRS